MSNYNDIQISGVGSVNGGRCGSVHISGSGKVHGAVECEEFHISGAGKVEDGGLTVHGPLHCSGACKVEGPVYAETAKISGSFSARSAMIAAVSSILLFVVIASPPHSSFSFLPAQETISRERRSARTSVKASNFLFISYLPFIGFIL